MLALHIDKSIQILCYISYINIPNFVFHNLRHPMVQKILDIYRALILCNVKMPAACPPLTFFYFYVNYTPEKQMYYWRYKLHSFITLLNHKIAIWWSFFLSAPMFTGIRHYGWCGVVNLRKPHCISTLWFSNDVDNHPNRDALDIREETEKTWRVATVWHDKCIFVIRQGNRKLILN